MTTLAGPAWGRYSGLLIAGFGLGPTVPICMTWSAELFGPRHGEVGVASASAIVSGLGNLGSVTTVYRLPLSPSSANMIGSLTLDLCTLYGMVGGCRISKE